MLPERPRNMPSPGRRLRRIRESYGADCGWVDLRSKEPVCRIGTSRDLTDPSTSTDWNASMCLGVPNHCGGPRRHHDQERSCLLGRNTNDAVDTHGRGRWHLELVGLQRAGEQWIGQQQRLLHT